MYETYPNHECHKKYGKGSMPEGRGNGKTRYPSKGCNKQDDTMRVHTKYSSLNGASGPSDTYPKGRPGHKHFPEVEGLPR